MESKTRNQFIDYLKAVCVIMVIITHYDWTDKTSPFFSLLINMAVPIFMILTGYNFAMSNQKNSDGRIASMYRWQVLKGKLVRFLAPFFAVCILEILLLLIRGREIEPFRIFVLGAYGPGSYYVPVMLQMLVIFPIIYVSIKKNAILGLVAAGAVNLIFEVSVHYFGMDKYYYRLLIGRYILLIAFGCYLYLHPKRRLRVWQMAIMLGAGFSYIYASFYMNREPLLFTYWTPTAMPVAFYIFPIVVILFRMFYHSTIPGRLGDLLAEIGKASYHIFLVQMVYYHFELGSVSMNVPGVVDIAVSVILCVCVGLSFYEVEVMLWEWKKKQGNIWYRLHQKRAALAWQNKVQFGGGKR